MHTIEEARAHSYGPVQLTAGGWRPAQRWSGPGRAAVRAELHGLSVGRPVRATVGPAIGDNFPPAVPGRRYGQEYYAEPGGATPLDYAQRLGRYWAQRAAVTHTVPPPGWRATPRQLRRLRHKANHAAAPFKRPAPVERVTNLATGEQHTEPLSLAGLTPEEFVAPWNEPARLGVAPPVEQQNPPERERSAINRNGYRVVDRRREHH